MVDNIFFSTLELKIHSRNILHKNSDHLIQFGFLEDFLAPLPAEKNAFKRKIEGALSCLRTFLATENNLKMIKNALYFTLKALLVLKVFNFLS